MIWWVWLIVTAMLLVGELLTEGFFLFWFALGALGATITAVLISSLPIQLLVFILISGILLFYSRQLGERLGRGKNGVDTNVDALIGKTGIVIKGIQPNETGLLKIGGQEWTCVSADKAPIPGGTVVQVTALQGVTLSVVPVKQEKVG